MQFKSVEDVNETVSELITPNDSSVGHSPLSAYESNSYLEVTQFTDYSQSVDRNFTPLPNERVKNGQEDIAMGKTSRRSCGDPFFISFSPYGKRERVAVPFGGSRRSG